MSHQCPHDDSCQPHHDIRRIFSNVTSTTKTYHLSLHDALPIYARTRTRRACRRPCRSADTRRRRNARGPHDATDLHGRSEEHTSELQSRRELVCRLLLEKKNIAWFTSYL